MKRHLLPFLLIITACVTNIRAETEMIDLKALAKKARPAVMLLIVSDANGKEIATSTGFMVSADGKLITNYHVVRNAAALVAKAENGSEFPAMSVLVEDSLNDLALVRIKGRDFAFLSLGAGDNAEVGSRIAVIGSPLGLEGTLSEGIISAVRVSPEGQRVLQISAAISPGSSGSPVLNAYGEVIGVAAAKRPGGESLNFAAPVKAAKVILAQGETAVAQRSFNEGVPQQGN